MADLPGGGRARGARRVESNLTVSDAMTLVSGRFRLGDLLGTGGSASVFRAVDETTGSPVALKILHPHLAQRPVAREAFLAEARRAAPLRHPNIVGLRDVGIDDGGDRLVAWIALELAPGASLSDHVARWGPLSPAEAVAVADGILRALEAAHAIGLIHRDVSPSNVMVAPDRSGALAADGVRLLDFGLADAAGQAALGTDELLSLDAAGRAGVMGNVNYMSPEHVRGLPVDERGDVYQAGAVVHFALTGRPPFPRSTTGQAMRAHLDTSPPAPSAMNPRVPRALDRIVVRAMLKQPDDRFASAAEMRAAVVGLTRGVAERETSSRETATMTDAASAAAPPSTSIAAAATAASVAALPEPHEVTRVLGRTRVPPRAPAGPGAPAVPAPTRRGARRVRPTAGAWLAGVAAAAVIAVVVVFASTSEPTASAGPAPSAVVPPAPAVTAPDPGPQPERTAAPVSTVSVPELVRLSVGEAASALAEAGLVLGEVTLVDSPFPADIVLSSSPAAGRRHTMRAAVALTAATGANAVPEVAGRTRSEAAAAVQAAGFVPAFASASAPAGRAPGDIVGTAPGAGTRLAVGETVTIHEADPEDPQPSPSPTTTPGRPTPTPTPTTTPGTTG